MYDGINGFSVNHFGTQGTLTNPTANSTAGSGTNDLTASLATYSSTNMCLGTNLLLEGTTDTSSLGTVITDWSDGYKATSTINLETFLGGALASWRGVCMVYYSSQYVMDNTNGAVCHVAVQSTDNIWGQSAQYLMHVPQATWAAPKDTMTITPS